MSDQIIQMQKVNKWFGDFQVLKDIDLEVLQKQKIVVCLLELVGMLNLAKTNPKWLGFAMEGYVFAAIIFWIICYAMSKYSYNLELKYKTER